MKLGKLLRQRSENKIRDSTGNIMLCVCPLWTTRFLGISSSFTVENSEIFTAVSEIFAHTIANASEGNKDLSDVSAIRDISLRFLLCD